ncbi:unnamed protein product [Tilletia caries]|nr:unnamed protein product [Tilletia caries]
MLTYFYSSTCSLEGSRAAPDFNLDGFEYLTHAYIFSSDSEHETPGSPTWSPFFKMFVQFAELWTCIVVSLRKSRPRSQLPITTIFGIASRIHHLLCRNIGSPTGPLQILNRSPYAFLLAIMLLAAFLHALTMAINKGTISTSRLFFNASNLPSLTEDYNLALFKLHTACLESTLRRSLRRELVNIRTPVGRELGSGSCLWTRRTSEKTDWEGHEGDHG